MRYLLLSDIHGAELNRVHGLLMEQQSCDKAIILGDLDRSHLAHELEDILAAGNAYAVPGNHDYDFINGKYISSNSLRAQGVSTVGCISEWKRDPQATALIQNMLDDTYQAKSNEVAGRKVIFELNNNKRCVAIHGALDGNHSYEPGDLWNRLLGEEDHEKNFRSMWKGGYKVMIRGHDHQPQLALKKGREIRIESDVVDQGFTIPEKTIATITVGALCEGYYAILDDSDSELNVIFLYDRDVAFESPVGIQLGAQHNQRNLQSKKQTTKLDSTHNQKGLFEF